MRCEARIGPRERRCRRTAIHPFLWCWQHERQVKDILKDERKNRKGVKR